MSSDPAWQLETLVPFGLLVRSTLPEGAAHLEALDPEQIHAWIAEHRVLLLRGFAPLSGGRLPAFCALLGEPLRWEFGLVNELIVKPDTQNYLYTNSEVPFHWDGAFVGRIPRYIFFHCVTAPPAGTGGETLFCDTTRLLAQLSPQDRARYEAIEIEYSTDKVVHYGGRFRSPMLGVHPLSGERIVRFAEPVEDLNPVRLEIHGIPRDEHATFLAETGARLRDPGLCQAHPWESGDVVIADNHALLHGRRAFDALAPRHIRRVNILAPPTHGTVVDFILDNLFIRRFEYFVAEIPILIISLLLCFPARTFFRTPIFWEGVAVFFLLFNFGDMINCLCDRDLDRVYKPHLSRAVYRLGVSVVRAQIAVAAIAAVAITAHLSWLLHNPFLVPLVLVGLGLGAAYSVAPVRLKSRGLLQLTCLWLIIFVGPMMLTSSLVTGFPRPVLIVLAAAYATLQMGVILFNTAEDVPEDEEAGVRTTVVSLGIHRGISLAVGMAIAGATATLGALAWIYQRGQVPLAAFAALAAPAIAYAIVVRSMWRVRRSITGKGVDFAVQRVKDVGRFVPAWVTAVAWSTMVAAIVLYVTAARAP